METKTPQESYYRRSLRMKRAFDQRRDLHQPVRTIAHALYAQWPLPEQIHRFAGTMHSVFVSVGMLRDPETWQHVPLALRLKTDPPYTLTHERDAFAEQFGAYEHASLEGENPPPYFAVAVTVPVALDGKVHAVAGMLTEDVSHGAASIYSPAEQDYIERIHHNGRRERFFVDPPFVSIHRAERHQRFGAKYLEDVARVDLK